MHKVDKYFGIDTLNVCPTLKITRLLINKGYISLLSCGGAK